MSAPDPMGVTEQWTRAYGPLETLDVEVSYRTPEGDATEAAAAPMVPGYTVHEQIGEGGMGVVYRARQESLGRDVAVKRTPPGSVAGRFMHEARLAARLDHPNVVPVHDLVTTEHGDVLVMKLVEGTRWSDELRRRAGDAQRRETGLSRDLEILLAVCNAVAFAHSRGVTHCDIKPANIMLGAYGEVYLADWGLAWEMGAPYDGVPRGTPRYMAPEQARGERPSAGTDVFLLGATLYEVLTGRPPRARGSFTDVVLEAAAGAAPLFDAAVPEALADICRTAMAADPAARYPHVPAFQGALRRFLEHRESARLVDAASATLEVARRATGEGAYPHFGEAVALYQQALASWPDNPAARHGEGEALRCFAEAALRSGDLGLAEAQARRLDEASVTRHDLLHRIEKERRASRARARAARVQRLLLVAAALVIVTGLVAGLLVLDAEKRRTQAQAEVASARLADVQRLADERRIVDLQGRADLLWPAAPSTVPAMEAWLAEARDVLGRLPGHRAWLERLRTEQGKRLRDAWRFDDARTQWEHDALQHMLEAGGTLASTVVPTVEQRLRAARALAADTIERPAADWARAIEAVAADPRFGGLRLAPQLGLVPLGADPVTRLQEFALRASGEAPRRNRAGALVRTDASAIVLVLVPGGRFRMGASRTGPHPDLLAKRSEGPVHEVALAPFMMSKYEMTQAQWLRATGRNPSSFPIGRRVGGREVGGLNPVEHVSWEEAVETLRRLELSLPTEAQWEYAARGGTATPWFTGMNREELRGYANLADAWARGHDGPESWRYEPWLNDGHTVHAPTGTFAPNPFGLHDVAGNVWEWVADRVGPYSRDHGKPAMASSGEPATAADGRHVFRGGGFRSTAAHARSAERYALYYSDNAAFDVGVRPMWTIRGERPRHADRND